MNYTTPTDNEKHHSEPLSDTRISMDKDSKKEIDDLVERVDKMVKTETNSGEGSVPNRDELQRLLSLLAAQKQQLDSMKKEQNHVFWDTQPVPKQDEDITESGPIEENTPYDQIRKEPLSIHKDFEWCEIDLSDDKELKELYDLLSLNYVEDDGAQFRFDYSAEFLKWAVQPPNWKKSWLVGVRVASNKKLVAFISGIPVALRTYDTIQHLTEINFLCVHKKLRSKRLAPVLIKEITRRSHVENIFQAVYTAGVLLPTPVSTCRYYHRSLNPKKLVECNFSRIPPKSTLSRMIKNYKLPTSTSTPGLRVMEQKDVPAVRVLANKYMSRFDIAPVFETDADIEHWILPHEKVVWSYVVEDPETGAITDFFSFYSLPSTVIGNPKHTTLNAAYMFYYGLEVPEDPTKQKAYINKRLNALMEDALILAKKADFDVFNTLNLMDNEVYLEKQKFGKGDGFLNYYLYNWKCPPIKNQKVGLVML